MASSFSLTSPPPEFPSAKLRGDENSSNYKLWQQQMFRILESRRLFGFIHLEALPGPPPSDDEQACAAWERMGAMLKDWIIGCLSHEVAERVASLGSAGEIWFELERTFSYPKVKDWNEYLPLYRAALKGDWDAAKAFIDQDPGAIEVRIINSFETALHVAVTINSSKSANFVANLVNYMSDEALSITNNGGCNPLHAATISGNLPAVEILVRKLPALLYVPCNWSRYPVQWAADVSHRPILEFLIYHTRNDQFHNPFAGDSGVMLLCFVIDADFFDLALDLVKKYPDLARRNPPASGSGLVKIAMKENIFSMDPQFNFLERLVYSKKFEGILPQQIPTLCKVMEKLVPRTKQIHKQIMLREQALDLVKCLCKHMESLNYKEAENIFINPIIVAARLGINEVIEIIVERFPFAIYCTENGTERTFVHLAVQNRCERVFNLLYQYGNHGRYYANRYDSYGNTILHLAAGLAPPHKLNLVSGAALQMQREIQWFKEVDKFIFPYNKEWRNNAGGTAKIIFTEEHKVLKVEGEKWMKDTANSCTIAAALIATVVFAAAITVPGGNESSGYPMFWESSAFTIFAISDAISLFTSTTSLMMFLSILTARYAEEDFLYRLPKRLCIGLVTLFLSILFMMVAFSSTVYIVFGRKHAWILLPVAALALLPISSFVLLQFPLLIDVITSTYGRGIFGKQN